MKKTCLLCISKSDTQLSLCDQCLDCLPRYHDYYSHAEFQSISLFQYAPPVSQLIKQLKFRDQLGIAKLFAKLWIRFIKDNNLKKPDLIIPVPLHYQRLKSRGFNQALEIAKPIGRFFKIPIDTKSCIRIKNTKPQSSLSARKRKANMKHAFALSYRINAKRVVIFDDVYTTGKTMHEIATLIQKTGVEHIELWSCARASL